MPRAPRTPDNALRAGQRALRAALSLLALGTGWQVIAALGDPRGLPWRAGLVGLAVAAGAGLLRAARPWTLAGSWIAALLLWTTLLEWTLERTELVARDALGFVAGALVTAWWLARGTAGLVEPAAPARVGAERLTLALAVTALTVFALEALALEANGLHTYDPLSSAPRHGPCLFRDEHHSARANPGYRGRFRHREFDGVGVGINALGLRDGLDEVAPPGPDEAVVICLGDSFAYGLGVALEDTFQERLEELLGSPGPRVFGAGIPGFGTRDARRQLRELSSFATPRLVVLALFEGNDFQDTHSARGRGPLPAPVPPGSVVPPRTPPPLFAFLAEVRSALFWRERCAVLQIGSTRGTGLPSLFMQEALAGDPNGRLGAMVDGLFEELALLREETAAAGAELIVLLVPSSVQAEPARLERFLASLPPDEVQAAHYDRRAFHDALAARLIRAGYRIADPLPLLEAQAAEQRSGYHVEGHWNARGHRTAARVLAPLVRAALGID